MSGRLGRILSENNVLRHQRGYEYACIRKADLFEFVQVRATFELPHAWYIFRRLIRLPGLPVLDETGLVSRDDSVEMVSVLA